MAEFYKTQIFQLTKINFKKCGWHTQFEYTHKVPISMSTFYLFGSGFSRHNQLGLETTSFHDA